MALGQRLDLRQAQGLVMTPQLQQAIKLLQMSNVELSAFVEEQIVENSLLEAAGPNDSDGAYDGEFDGNEGSEPPEAATVTRDSADVVTDDGSFDRQLDAADTDYSNVWDDGIATDQGYAGGSEGGDSLVWQTSGGGQHGSEDGQGWEAYAEQEISLREHLERQINLEFTDPLLHRVALVIADSLDEAGYFVGDFAEMAYLLGVDQATVATVHQEFLQLDPPGIGARGLSECLQQQLAEMDALNEPMQALLDNLELIGRGDFQRAARLCGTDLGGLQTMLERLKRCVPRPAAAFDHEPALTVIPDVFVRRAADGSWVVELNGDALPQVLVNRAYYATIRRGARDKHAVEFVTQQWQTANWLIKALDQRANTILKVTTSIVQAQDRFFEQGVSGLRPMTLRDIADEIQMHESTVSRVTNGKYMATPRGVMELKFFFSNAIPNANGTDAHSAEAVRHHLKRLIEGEALPNVLSDEALVDLLQEQGITVARRTVAKYREGMNIPSSAKRRRLLKLAAG
jgi:RNA polymerase sigma-54 factor